MNVAGMLIQVQNLDVGYRKPYKKVLFENLNLVLSAGTLICFMGPNGIGKSTLLRTLAGLQKPLAGKVLLSPKAHKLETFVSVVLTEKPSMLYLTAEELIAFGRYPYLNWRVQLTQPHQQIIEQAMETTHVTPFRHRRLFELSDGQLQLALIARALAQETPVMLLDEPTAHLDLNNRVEIMNLLRQIAHRENKAILVATHELDLALQTADRVWLAGAQKNILTGIPEDLVLSGVFDEIFQWKGFDLKTGKIMHQPWRNIPVDLIGEGPEYLWTKNALERNGYFLQQGAAKRIVIQNTNPLTWVINQHACTCLEEVLEKIKG